MKTRAISVVVPVFNSARTLHELVARIEAVLDSVSNEHEIILVNDASRDESWQVMEQIHLKNAHVKIVDLMRNFGQHNALLCGIRQARYELTVTIDDDLQHPPEEIPKLIEKLDQGFDVVYGTPLREPQTLWRNFASRLTKLSLQSVMGVETARTVSAFRVVRTALRDAFSSYQGTFVSLDVLLSWGTSRFGSVAVRHDPRLVGKSNYTFRKLVFHALNVITGFSILPLQLASILGLSLTLFGIMILFYVIGRYLIEQGSVPGFPFLASTLAIFSGAQLFALGIIGEYVARMHFRLMGKPPYVQRRKVELNLEDVGI